jgi:hypothetical protein
MNAIHVLDPKGRVIANDYIETGASRSARRVPAAFVRQIPKDGIVEVETSRGWERRVIVEIKGCYYTRTAPKG